MLNTLVLILSRTQARWKLLPFMFRFEDEFEFIPSCFLMLTFETSTFVGGYFAETAGGNFSPHVLTVETGEVEGICLVFLYFIFMQKLGYLK